ncbi:NAD(P)H:quinone oxidoreductase [Planctobacterium marinum]|uniref:NAD(P)H:quinone oxidoreductase n=1 Tax=Planctobacterium marinum TaxID=1631968 RepID=UPI001E502E65|nr:NAD(P)H:quinone oxidoreductase [Planctobacterium marinum]MCC2604164.1 NAD(P)H:quinone oxidoreductase [Planctobacterium marinum]
MAYILVLYYSRHGATKKLAEQIALGIASEELEARIMTVAQTTDDTGSEYASQQDLADCAALAMGSPTRFGQMAAPLQRFLQDSTALWLKGSLVDKPAMVFTSSSSMHGGQESTLLSMSLPLIHQGMLLCGIPYSEPELHDTKTGGTPYGASHVVSNQFADRLSEDEKQLAFKQGKRLAQITKKLMRNS